MNPWSNTGNLMRTPGCCAEPPSPAWPVAALQPPQRLDQATQQSRGLIWALFRHYAATADLQGMPPCQLQARRIFMHASSFALLLSPPPPARASHESTSSTSPPCSSRGPTVPNQRPQGSFRPNPAPESLRMDSSHAKPPECPIQYAQAKMTTGERASGSGKVTRTRLRRRVGRLPRQKTRTGNGPDLPINRHHPNRRLKGRIRP